ncbi:MAG: Glyoxalase/bleomycin resistance protein/dioxygenase [Nevskia sp.]|nr:Glyoxalase/bleomycin resistance protein/dioxygenase [Nevskia sp.]
MTNALQISRLGQIALTVQNLPRAEAFYRDVLGLQHLFNADGRMSFFTLGGTRLMLGLAERTQEMPRGTILYWVVADIEAAFAQLAAAGARILHPPHFVAQMPDHDLWLGFFEDGEGNTLSLMSERPRSA